MINAKLRHSSAFRLAFLYSLLSISMMVVLLSFIYWTTAGYMDRQLNETIDEEVQALSEEYNSGGLAKLTQSISDAIRHNMTHEAIYLLVDSNFDPIIGNLRNWPDISHDAIAMSPNWVQFQLKNWPNLNAQSVGLHNARAKLFVLQDDLHLLVGRSTQTLEVYSHRILEMIVWGALLTIGLSLGLGWIMSRRVMRRLETINQTSREIMKGDLSRRIPLENKQDDFDYLAGNLNHMLDRIETLMSTVRQVSDNIAHDLRTPLSRLHTRLAEINVDIPQTHEDALNQAMGDVDELLIMFNALLRIARIESGQATATFSEVNISQLVRDLAEFYEPLLTEKGQELILDVTEDYSVQGDRDLLFQMLANLLDNASKYSPQSGQILFKVQSFAKGGVEVILADSGIGIPKELHEKVFQRFYRTDASRNTQGTGLGLSLVKAVAKIHKINIQLSDNDPGLKMTLIFPLLEVKFK